MILLINDGLILYGIDMIDMMAIPISMIKSLLMTITVNHPGIIPFIDKRHKATCKESLIRYGIQICPQYSLLVQYAGKETIKGISDSRNSQNNKCLCEVSLHEEDYRDRNKEDSQQRQ